MHIYTSKYPRLSGSSYDEVLKRARAEYHVVAQSSKRQPYVRSKYFNSSKIFLDVFWTHLMQKHPKERRKRLKFYKAALDLLRHSQIAPDTIFGQMISTLCYTASTASRKTVRTSACRSRKTSVPAARTSCQSLIGNRVKAHQIKISRCVA